MVSSAGRFLNGKNLARATTFPVLAGTLVGLGLGGFFDGIVLHQVLQWHHVASAWYPAHSLENMSFNTFFDGIFHIGTYIFVSGLLLLWRHARNLAGTILIGFGAFNCVEGAINHHLLGLHHVNETVDRDMQIYWDVGFLVWGGAMLWGGWYPLHRGRHDVSNLTSAAGQS
ncbi:DUF2243 domain-containing protein [Bosea sp. BK604]|uniref:DUF2243 domain-containing protein n=1 Tax=Bosea sp. BK604 TaxID=2512180 RepID=UPI001043DDEB|nr:DUF2243 domain-containing protein [Bosea sp. BK604]